MSRVAELLGTQHPILQGAMGVISNPELVAAVSEAGGFGLLATTFVQDPRALREQVRATRRLTNRPFGANLFVMNPLATALAEALAEEGVGAVTVSGGSPKTLLPILRRLGLKALVVVPTAEAARSAEGAGADAVVAEGLESGGVQGVRGASTLVLVPAVVDAVSLPVVAAGGIADSRGYRAALALGAGGVQVGTRFIATRECAAHARYKNALASASEVGTAVLDLGRFRLRALRTPLVERALSGEIPAPAFSERAFDAGWLGGDADASALPAGEAAGLVRGVASVREVIEEMVR